MSREPDEDAVQKVMKAIEGGQKLLGFSAEKIAAGECREGLALLAHALRAMAEAHQVLTLAYALSGRAADDMLGDLRRQFEDPP